jgi:hypothetical protein
VSHFTCDNKNVVFLNFFYRTEMVLWQRSYLIHYHLRPECTNHRIRTETIVETMQIIYGFYEKKEKINPGVFRSSFIPCELLLTGRHRHRSGSPRTYLCLLLLSRYPWRWPMQDIHSRRFHIRYTYLCQRLLPTRSLQGICFGEDKKSVSISTHVDRVACEFEKI